MPLPAKAGVDILLIEDDPKEAERIALLAGDLGHRVRGVVSSPAGAMDMIEENPLDLVLMDIHLPGDHDAVMIARGIWEQYGLPVVFISSGSDEGALERAVGETACFGFIIKPVRRIDLKASVALAFNRYRFSIERRRAEISSRRRRQTEETLRNNFRLMETLLNTVPNPVFYKDTQGIYLGCNDAFAEKILGLPKERITGAGLYDFPSEIPRGMAEKYHQSDLELMRRPGTQIYEGRVRCADGDLRDFIFNKATFPDKSGRVAGIIGIMMDITERKKVEDELRRLHRAVEQSPSSVVITDLKGAIEYVNPKFTEVTGYSLDEALGENPRILKSDAQDPLVHRELWKTISSGHEWHGELRNRKKSGELYWESASISPVKNKDGRITHFVAVKEDITNRKKMEDTLRESEERYRILFNSITDLILTHDMDGRILSINPAMELFLGYQIDEIIGRLVSDYIVREFRDDFQNEYLEDIKENGHADGVMIVQAKDGARYYLEYRNKLVTTEEQTYVSSSSRDITDRIMLERELKRAKKAAEAASRAKSEFLASMSHEIRTPMNAILGMIDLTLQDNLSEEQKDNLKTARDSARHLLHIINDILDLSKIEAGKVELEETGFDLYALIRSIDRSFAHQAENKVIDHRFHIQADVPRFVKGDSFRLRQILVNLIGNAIKFTEYGEIRIEIKKVEPESVPVEGEPSEADSVPLLFSVRDTGIGIPQENILKIFDNFSQADHLKSRKYGGTGLGLSISKHLVEMMNGRIWVESEVGKGSDFSFTAVLKPGDRNVIEREEFETDPVWLPTTGALKILLAEDNPINAKVAGKLLGRLGFSITVAGNGREVIDLLSGGLYHLVLMDVEMPVMDGLEATARIRAGEAGQGNQAIPIIAMTAHALAEFKEKCEKAGMNDYVAKPVDFYELSSIIEKNAVTGDYSHDPPQNAPMEADERTLLEKSAVLRRIGGDTRLLDYLYTAFAEEIPDKIDSLNRAVREVSGADIYYLAHAIKGNCATVGAHTCEMLAAQLQKAAKKGTQKQIENLVGKLAREMAKVRQVLIEED